MASRFPQERQMQLLALIRDRKRVGTAELAALLGASLPTVRRDLSTLEAGGLVARTRGGVVLRGTPGEGAGLEPLYLEKIRAHRALKQRIAAAAAAEVETGATVIIDSGTTALELARCLSGRAITVVALDLKVAETVATGQTEVWLVGGRLRHGLFNVTGTWTLEALQNITADLFFLAADAVDSDKVTNATVDEAAVKKVALERSQRSILIADHSKLNKRKFAPVCEIGRPDLFITDREGADLLRDYEARFKRVLYA